MEMDQRKRRRMESNRESARRSRQRKQRRVDELTAQAMQMREENARMAALAAGIAEGTAGIKMENSVLRTRIMELAERLKSLNEILFSMQNSSGDVSEPWVQHSVSVGFDADMFQYC